MSLLKFTLYLGIFLLINGLCVESIEEPEVVGGNKTDPWGLRMRSNNNSVCLMLSFSRINVDIHSKTIVSNKTYDMKDIEVVSGESHCTVDDIQRLTLQFPDDLIMRFEFKQNSTTRTYILSELSLEVKNSTYLERITNSSSSEPISKEIVPDLKVKPIGRGYSFECKHRYVFKMTKNETVEYKIRIHGFKFWAFRRDKPTLYYSKTEKVSCPAEPKKAKPGNDIIPIAVGGVLTGCLVISLIGYLIIRARKT